MIRYIHQDENTKTGERVFTSVFHKGGPVIHYWPWEDLPEEVIDYMARANKEFSVMVTNITGSYWYEVEGE